MADCNDIHGLGLVATTSCRGLVVICSPLRVDRMLIGSQVTTQAICRASFGVMHPVTSLITGAQGG